MKQPLQPFRLRILWLVVLLAAAIGVMFALRQCGRRSASGAEGRPEGDTINVAIEYSPTGVMSAEDSLGGFAYEMLTQIADSEGLVIKFNPIVSLSSALERLEEGYYDIVVADVPITSTFADRYSQTAPVYLDRLVLVQPRDTAGRVAVNTSLDLAGRHVRVVAGSPAIDRLNNLSREIGDTIHIDVDSTYGAEQLFLLTAAGEIPMAVVNASVAEALSTDNPNVDISNDVSFTQFQGWVKSRHASKKIEALDSAIVRFRRTPAYRQLTERYGLTPVER